MHAATAHRPRRPLAALHWFGRSRPTTVESHRELVNRLDRDRLYETLPYRIPLPPHLGELLHHLACATAVDPRRVPPDLITMNSVVRLEDPISGCVQEHTLVYSYQADLMPMGTSIAAPAGAAMFGRRVGDRVVWTGAGGERIGMVAALLYQPEREGNFDR